MQGLPHEWLTDGLEKSAQILALVLAGVSQEQSRQVKDGDDGWSVLEIVCHLRDYQDIFAERIRRMLEEERPAFQLYDEEARLALVSDNDYANQDLRAVFESYRAKRRWLIERLAAAPAGHWLRQGRFAVDDVVDVEMAVVHTLLHDADHGEQIARILRA
ncbi:MAG: DinB family protein [Chloroflexi bacterium]|nr:DinB family protein [Chloroflexota bacterium]